MKQIPKVKSVEVIGHTQLLVTFENGVKKVYNCKPLFSRPQFHLLETFAIFKAVHVDRGGHGISWRDDIDLSEEDRRELNGM